MAFDKIKIFLNDNHAEELPSWFQFFSEIGAYLFKNRKLNSERIHIAITLPDTPFVPLIAAVGMSDRIFTRRFYSKNHAKRIMNLKQGQTVYYFRDSKRIVCSFIGISDQHPFFKDEKSADLKSSKNEIIRLAERHWSKIQIATEKHTYKRRRNVEGFGIDSKILNKMYGKDKLLKAAAEYSTEFYIIGNKVRLIEMAEEEKLEIDNINGLLSELLCFQLNTRHTYYHSEIISSTGKLPDDFNLVDNIPVIYTDAVSYLNRYGVFSNHPSLIFLNRTDSNERNEEVVLDIKRRITQGNVEFITNQVLEEINNLGYKTPIGIEFLAWREFL